MRERGAAGQRAMEMQQVRYFLALANTLNFTRAAEECSITQPALTRSIKLLEDELGGTLIRRERSHSHLTELGRRMLPLLQQCYDSASSAKSLAREVGGNQIAPVRLAIAHCVNMAVLASSLGEVIRAAPGAQFKISRGTPAEVMAALKDGEADMAVAATLEGWDRLDSWPLFSESMELAVHADHPLGRRNSGVGLGELAGESLLRRFDCEVKAQLSSLGVPEPSTTQVEHEVETDHDLIALLEANAGVAFLAATAPQSSMTRRLRLLDFDLTRTIKVYAVAGRMRSAATGLLLNLLRAADWSHLGVSEPA
jgi:DNA-binding transcriptional LysR family regulator